MKRAGGTVASDVAVHQGPRRRASDIAYDELKRAIIDGELPPRTLLGEVETASRVGVSRTPLPEALSRLVAEGLVVDVGRARVVASFSRADVIELFELREALEVRAAKLAARRRRPEPFAALRSAMCRPGAATAGA